MTTGERQEKRGHGQWPLVLGIIALAKRRPGKGMAIAGIVLGSVVLVFAPVMAGTLARMPGKYPGTSVKTLVAACSTS